MSGDGQAQSRLTVAQVGAELDDVREEIAALSRAVTDAVAELREQLADHAAALGPRLDRLARRRRAAAERAAGDPHQPDAGSADE